MWGSWYTSWRCGEKGWSGDAGRGRKVASKGQDGAREEHFLQEERLQEGVWAVGRSLIWAAGVGRSLGRERLAVGVSHVVVQEERDPVGGSPGAAAAG